MMTSRKHEKIKRSHFSIAVLLTIVLLVFFWGVIITNLESMSFEVSIVYRFIDHIFLFYEHVRAINFLELHVFILCTYVTCQGQFIGKLHFN